MYNQLYQVPQIRAVTLAIRARQDAASIAKIGKSADMAVAPVRWTVSLCHHSGRPPRARPARRKDDVFRQVSWLRGSSSFSAFPSFDAQSPVANLKKDSPPTVAGAAPDLTRHRNGESRRIPFWADQRDRRT